MSTTLVMYLCLVGTYPKDCTSEEVWAPKSWNGAGPAQEQRCKDAKLESEAEILTKAPDMKDKIRFECESQSWEV